MKSLLTILAVAVTLIAMNGCTRIEKLQPSSGPAGSTVYVKTAGMWGNPIEQHIKWDGEIISDPFPGSFTVPATSSPGKHKVTLVDELDADEAFLLFPIFRKRTDSATFTVTEN